MDPTQAGYIVMGFDSHYSKAVGVFATDEDDAMTQALAAGLTSADSPSPVRMDEGWTPKGAPLNTLVIKPLCRCYVATDCHYHKGGA